MHRHLAYKIPLLTFAGAKLGRNEENRKRNEKKISFEMYFYLF